MLRPMPEAPQCWRVCAAPLMRACIRPKGPAGPVLCRSCSGAADFEGGGPVCGLPGIHRCEGGLLCTEVFTHRHDGRGLTRGLSLPYF